MSELTFGQRVTLYLGNLDVEGSLKRGARGDNGEDDGVVVVQPHVNVHYKWDE